MSAAPLHPLAPTPYLTVDADRLRTNVEAMAAVASRAGVALRPHVKTHKCIEIATMQVAAGAQGISVATLGEAEVFAAAGFDDIFVAYPLWLDDDRIDRVVALSRRDGMGGLRLGVDSVEGVGQMARAAKRGAQVDVLVEIDSGHHRSGVAPRSAGEIAAAARRAKMSCVGVFTFPGHSYAPGSGRRDAARNEAAALMTATSSLVAAGFEQDSLVVSGGSTPSVEFTAADMGVGVGADSTGDSGAGAEGSGRDITELRPGVYVFGDAQQWELGACRPEDIALTAHATVVSHAGGRLVLDSGSKVLGADRPAWASGFGRLLDHRDARIVILSEHHAVVDMGHSNASEPAAALPRLGSVVRVVPNHACNAVNLVDELVVTSAGAPPEAWKVAARGKNG